MPVGIIQTSIQCVLKVPNSGNSTAPCITIGVDRYVPLKQSSYVIDPAAAAALDAVAGPVDYASLGGLWGFSFTTTLVLWLLAKKVGIVVQAVRRF